MADFFEPEKRNHQNGCGLLDHEAPPAGRTIPRKSQQQWRLYTQRLCLAQAVVGPLWFILTSLYLGGDSRMNSQVVGILMTAIGTMGYIGLKQQRPHFLMVHLVATGVGMMLVAVELSKIDLQVKLHCSSAYSMLKIDHLERHLEEFKQDEMFSSLYTRVNEIDDMLDMIQKGEGTSGLASASASAASADKVAAQDMLFIQTKVARLKTHAEQSLKMMTLEEKDLKAKAASGEDVQKKLKRTTEGIQFATKIVERLTSKGKNDQPLSFQEYSTVLGLLQSHASLVGPGRTLIEKNLEEDSGQLPLLKATWKKAISDSKATGETAAMRKVREAKEQRRKQWEAEFQEAYGIDSSTGNVARLSLQHRMTTAMQNMPQICLQETRAWYGFELLGWFLIMFQAGVAYGILANLMLVPLKVQ